MKLEEQPYGVLGRVLILAAWSLPALCGLHAMLTHWVAVPFWDEWDTPGAQLASYYRGTLSLAELFSQHNEHRLFFPRLIWLPLAILGGWDVRFEMLLTFGFVCLGALGLWKLLQFSGAPATARAAVFGLIVFLLFSPREYETFLVGAQGQTFVPTFALVFALLINLSGRSLAAKTLINGLFAIVATYSFGNGILVWLFAFPIETRKPTGFPDKQWQTRIAWRILYLAAGALSIALYFVSYRHPALSPPIVSPLAQSPAFARFVLVWIGSLFSVKAPAVLGAILLLLFAGLTTAAWRQARRTGDWKPHYPWLALGAYTLISASIAAVARLGFPWSMAGDSRYTTFSSFFYIALAGLAFSIGSRMTARVSGARLAGAFLSLAILGLWLMTWRAERQFLRTDRVLRKHNALIVQWSDAIPRNPEIALLSPYPTAETLETIRAIAGGSALRPRLVSASLARKVNQLPAAPDAAAGALEQAFIGANGRLSCSGWAIIPDQNRPADCVVLGFEKPDGAWEPFSVFETGSKREDIVARSGFVSLQGAGFSRSIEAKGLPRTAARLRVCAIDLSNERVFPLAGEITLPAPR